MPRRLNPCIHRIASTKFSALDLADMQHPLAGAGGVLDCENSVARRVALCFGNQAAGVSNLSALFGVEGCAVKNDSDPLRSGDVVHEILAIPNPTHVTDTH